MARLTGTKQYLYFGSLGTEVSGDDATPLATEGFYKITAAASPGSVWPIGFEVGDVIYNKPALTPATGDAAKPITLNKLAFVTDVPMSGSKEKFENTVQTDDIQSYEEGDKPEMTGSVNGYFVFQDDQVDLILKRFFRIITDDGAGSYTVTETTTGAIHAFLGRKETTTVGEVELMEYKPMIIDGLTADKPMQGPQVLNFNYTVVGSEKPSFTQRTITA